MIITKSLKTVQTAKLGTNEVIQFSNWITRTTNFDVNVKKMYLFRLHRMLAFNFCFKGIANTLLAIAFKI